MLPEIISVFYVLAGWWNPQVLQYLGKLVDAKWNADLDQFTVRSPRISASEPLPVVRDAKPLCWVHIMWWGGCISHSPCSSDSPPLLSSPGAVGVGETNYVQTLINGSGDAGAAADQVCNVQRLTLQNETWKWVKISSTESASSVCGCFLFISMCKFCLRMWKV